MTPEKIDTGKHTHRTVDELTCPECEWTGDMRVNVDSMAGVACAVCTLCDYANEPEFFEEP